jgi:hypothetical protein
MESVRKLSHDVLDPDGVPHGANQLVLRGDWALWSDLSSKNYGAFSARGLNLKTGATFELAGMSSEMSFANPDTDGHRLVVGGFRSHTYFKTVGWDLYRTDFPPSGPTTITS